jgi:uncharacterized protein
MKTNEATRKIDVDDFLAQKTFALVGVSRKNTKFGNGIYKELKQKGYRIFPVNPNMDTYDGVPCYKDLKSLPELVDGVIITVHPSKTEQLVKDTAAIGVKRVWIQQGSQSDAAIKACRENDLTFISKECILMYANPVQSVHKFHRWLWKIFGKLPQ